MNTTPEADEPDARFINELAKEVAATFEMTPRWNNLDAIVDRYINGMVDAAAKQNDVSAIDFTTMKDHAAYRDTGLPLAFRVWCVNSCDFIVNVEGLNLRKAISEQMAGHQGDPNDSAGFIAALQAEVDIAKAIYAEHYGKPYEA